MGQWGDVSMGRWGVWIVDRGIWVAFFLTAKVAKEVTEGTKTLRFYYFSRKARKAQKGRYAWFLEHGPACRQAG